MREVLLPRLGVQGPAWSLERRQNWRRAGRLKAVGAEDAGAVGPTEPADATRRGNE